MKLSDLCASVAKNLSARLSYRRTGSICGLAVLIGALAGCGSTPDAPTLADLATRPREEPQPVVDLPSSRDKAIDAYRAFLSDAPTDSPLRAEATRRLADLGQEQLDDLEADPAGGEPQQLAGQRQAIIDLYTKLIRRYPDNPRTPEALYQLSRAYESVGQRRRALAVLDRLVRQYPDSNHLDEVQFRRGETLYVDQRYREAEDAYRAVIGMGEGSDFYDQALYKGGWALFKQQRYEAALDLFTEVLDRRVVGGAIPMQQLTDVERERISDTLRVGALSFSYQAGAGSVSRYFQKRGAKPYEHLIYRTLGEQYLDRERYSDAAATFQTFADQRPLHREAPRLQLMVIHAYQRAGFADQVLDAKRDFVSRYGMDQPYWSTVTREEAADIVAEVKKQVDELSRYFHAQAQRTKTRAAYDEAIRWYRKRLAYFPGEKDSADSNFLLAELLVETRRFAEAAREYEKTAYQYPDHRRSAEAGYAALLAYAAHGDTLPVERRKEWQRQTLSSSDRFVERFPTHPETPRVLAKLAEQLFAIGEGAAASNAAQRLVDRYPGTDPKLRRNSWLVIAHHAFDQDLYGAAENGYQQALALTARSAQDRASIVDRLGASVYKQGEQLRAQGDLIGAATTFLRVARVAPRSTIRATADFDAAAALLANKQWHRATVVLQGFRRQHPGHPLQGEVTEKLAVAYLESGQTGRAAREFGNIATSGNDPVLRREAAWRSAELYQRAEQIPQAIEAWERYVRQHPRPVSDAVEARYILLKIHQERGDRRQVRDVRRAIIAADGSAGSERTDRTRYLAAEASLALAGESVAAFEKIVLKEPLQRSLTLKRAAMKQSLAELGAVADYGVADMVTAATYQTANVYRHFAKALMDSERPGNLDEEGLEEYELLLEEQAYPFEQKAIEVHAINTRRTLDGIYDEWVRRSFEQLAQLMPARYAKRERSAEPRATLD